MQQQPPYYLSTSILIIVMNIISFLSLSFVIFIYILKWSKISSFPLRLVTLFLTYQTILVILSVYILHNPEHFLNQYQQQNNPNSGYCKFDAIVKTTADLSSIIWTTLIIYSVYATIVRKKNLSSVQISYLVFGYAFPLIVAIMYDYYYYYYYVDRFFLICMVQMGIGVGLGIFALKMAYFFGPLWVAFALNVFMSIKSYKTLKLLGMNQRQLIIFKRLMLFPFIMLFTQFFQTADIIVEYKQTYDPQWLDFIANFFSSCYGIANAIAYGLNPIIRQQIQQLFKISKHKQNRQRQLSNISNLMTERSQQSNRDKRYTQISDY